MKKQVYIQLLIEVSKSKSEILQELIEITGKQGDLLRMESFDEGLFQQTITQKEEQLRRLEELDRGFDQTFESVREELVGNKYKYEAEIKALQEYITVITDRSVALQAMEQRNRANLEAVLVHKRREMRRSLVSTRTATAYYKTMTNQNEIPACFYDKKK